jgi:hypothetical protein
MCQIYQESKSLAQNTSLKIGMGVIARGSFGYEDLNVKALGTKMCISLIKGN